ncbi:hypothetical protein Trydic_g19291 [Trypoxylus dichotomus]
MLLEPLRERSAQFAPYLVFIFGRLSSPEAADRSGYAAVTHPLADPPQQQNPFQRAEVLPMSTTVTGQSTDMNYIEKNLSNTIQQLEDYYRMNQLRPNSSKAQTYLFHLDNRQAMTKLDLEWDNVRLEHFTHPV